MNTPRFAPLGLVLLAGCASGPPVEVKVPVPVPCLQALPRKPAFPADSLSPRADVFTKGKVLWADRLARKAYELELETALAACVKP